MGESVSEASRDVPVPPNGSSMTSIKNEVQSDKLTSEKLQEIEDEEILDKLVLYFSCCYIQISTYQRTEEFWGLLVTKQLLVAIDFHSMETKYCVSQ